MENVDFGEMLGVLGALAGAIVVAGVFFSRLTKTDKDDKFFARLSKALGIKE